ncbi:uncharacterized protein LOC127279861 isoform X5 [Leptopilina boulardi]|uniref:uncharacterized protein LOC127279861 isoform X5 n=1 Tax=Leptopilina boulardi TaxID=63433 RepID=UPI0021F67763|nr:uncharacterized protein LOC127279861 isoform X5 [Leptopilina boulardi]
MMIRLLQVAVNVVRKRRKNGRKVQNAKSDDEYIASHLDPFECRRLVAALHYSSQDLPKSLSGAERKVNEEIPCLRQLLHWNMSTNEGKGKTHEELERRLRQMNRNDLAEWLGKETFKQLGKDLGRALDHPFGEFDEEQIEITENTKPKKYGEEIQRISTVESTENNYESEDFEI